MRTSVKLNWVDRGFLAMFRGVIHFQAFLMTTVGWMVGKERAIRIAQGFVQSNEMQQAARMMGSPDAGERMNTRLAQKRRATPEHEEWSWFIQDYGEKPEPETVPRFLSHVEKAGALEDHATELPTAAAILSLAERHPEHAAGWRKRFPSLFKAATNVLLTCGPERAGWNDYYMARWFILRDDDSVKEIMRRAWQEGDIGASATWMVASVSNTVPAFKAALDRVGYAPPQPAGPVMAQPEFPPYSESEAEEARRRAVQLTATLMRLNGARIENVEVTENLETRLTSVILHTDVADIAFGSTSLLVDTVNLKAEAACPTQ